MSVRGRTPRGRAGRHAHAGGSGREGRDRGPRAGTERREAPQRLDGPTVPEEAAGEEALYGVHPVLDALEAGRPVERIVLLRREEATGGRLGQVHRLARERGIPVQFAPLMALDRLSGGGRHQGVVAVLAARATVSLEAILAAGPPPPSLLLLADGVQDPRNLGALVRTAAAAGAAGVVIPAHGACGLTPAVAKAASGALEAIPVAREGNIAEVVTRLKDRGWWVVGLDAHAGESWTDPDFSVPTALVVGGEEGLRELVRNRCDRLVGLPLAAGVESLNVSVAAGIVLYEVLRQRGVRGGPGGGKFHAEPR